MTQNHAFLIAIFGTFLFSENCTYLFSGNNIAIMRAFVEVRKILLKQGSLKEQLNEIKERLGEHDAQLNHIYDAMENLLDQNAAQRKWSERKRIGF